MKIATLDDLQEIKDMAARFLAVTGYANYSDEETIENLIVGMLTGRQDEKIILLKPGIGMLAGISSPFIFGPHLIASEIAWWIEPEKRGQKDGVELVEAFEYWAKFKAACAIITLTSLDDKVGKFYESRGYKLHERAYMKEI